VTGKQGVSLRTIDGFPPALADRLRDDLSVTTGEEFLDLAARTRSPLRAALGIDEDELTDLERLVGEVAERVPDDAAPAFDAPAAGAAPPFMTGFELPEDDA